MSRPSQLPPRCPLQRKAIGSRNPGASSFGPHRINESGTRHQKSLSQSSLFEDQPAWLDDLLSESDSIPKGIAHCRSASDSGTVFDGLLPNVLLSASNQEEHSSSEEGGKTLESGFVYGPNSPRRMSNVEISDSSVLLALSDYANQSCAESIEDISWCSRNINFDIFAKQCGTPSDINNEPKSEKRRPGQRSRARKLQYIAELENSVNFFQALGSELAIRISDLIQERAVLSTENIKLKQQMARLQQQNLLIDGEYQTLKKEAERLKIGLASSLTSQIYKLGDSSDTDAVDISWQKLDWTKLNL